MLYIAGVFGTLGVVFGALLTSPAAVPADWTVNWSAPAQCPQEDELRARVERYGDAMVPASGPFESIERVDVRGTIRNDDGAYVLDLRTETVGAGSDGPFRTIDAKVLRSDSCEVVADAAALLVSVATRTTRPDPTRIHAELDARNVAVQSPVTSSEDPTETTAPSDPTPTPRAEQTADPVVVADRTPGADRPSPNREPRAAGDLGVQALVASGPLPRAQPGLGLDGRALFAGRWALEIGASFTAPGRFSLPETPGAGAAAWHVAGRARGCFAPHPRPWLGISTCLGVEAGAVVARGHGLDAVDRTAIPWFAALAGADLAFRVAAPLWITAGVEGFGSPTRPVLTIGGVDRPLATGQPFGIRGRLGMRVAFGAERGPR